MKKIIAILFTALCTAGISAQEKAHVLVTGPEKDGSVPREKLIYKALPFTDQYSLDDMDRMYREDILETETHYETNLKNMWFMLLNERLVESGTDEQKRFYVQEQVKLKQNMPHFFSFYSLLRNCSFYEEKTKLDIASGFYEKNKKFIENVVDWRTPEEKKDKLGELAYQYRTLRLVPHGIKK